MGKSDRDTSGAERPESFDSAIKSALRRGMEERGARGARQSMMGRGQARWSPWNVSVSGLFGAVSKRDVYALCQQLAVLLECGMPLVRALNTLANRTHNPTLARVVRNIGVRVEEGSTFSDAVARHPRIFPPLVVNIFRAGELSGNLVEALYRVAEHGERLTLSRHKAYAALIYPAVLIVVAVLVITFAFSFTVARLRPLFDTFGVEPPAPMRILMTAGEYFSSGAFWGIAVFVVIVAIVAYRLACLFRGFRLLKDRIKVRLPLLRYYVKQNLVADFSRIFATLYRSGVPLLETLQATHDTTRNEVLKLGIERVMDAVREGGPISEHLEQSDVFPPLAYDLIAVGEEAGALDRIFTRLADYYDEKQRADLEMLAKIVQPLIIVLLALVIGFIAISFISMYVTIIERVQ